MHLDCNNQIIEKVVLDRLDICILLKDKIIQIDMDFQVYKEDVKIFISKIIIQMKIIMLL